MRILHVITWVAPGNPFGGPLRVALNQAAEMRRRGHHVELIAAQPRPSGRVGWSSASQGVRGFDAVRVLPGLGFSGMTSFGLLRHVWSEAGSFDVVHVHLARDLVTLPAAVMVRGKRVPFFLQTHGMVDRSARRSARLLDRLFTRRVLASARSVFVLNDQEHADLVEAFPDETPRYETLPNGVPVPHVAGEREAGNREAGQREGRTGPTEVLFCSRLHRRKRPALFAAMAVALLDEGCNASFSIVGSDEGELTTVRQVLDRSSRGSDVRIEGSIEPDAVPDRLAGCDLLVLPSVDEPFGMVVVEALAAGRPVVVTDSCGLAPFVLEHGCGLVVPGDDLDALTVAVRRLVDNDEERREMGKRGRGAVAKHFGMSAIGDQLERCYGKAIQPTVREPDRAAR